MKLGLCKVIHIVPTNPLWLRSFLLPRYFIIYLSTSLSTLQNSFDFQPCWWSCQWCWHIRWLRPWCHLVVSWSLVYSTSCHFLSLVTYSSFSPRFHALSTLRFFYAVFAFSVFFCFFLFSACAVRYVTKCYVSLYALCTLRKVVEITLYDDDTMNMKLNDENKMKLLKPKYDDETRYTAIHITNKTQRPVAIPNTLTGVYSRVARHYGLNKDLSLTQNSLPWRIILGDITIYQSILINSANGWENQTKTLK